MAGRLAAKERDGCQEILRMMSADNLLSLYHTVTNKDDRRIPPSEAIYAILSNSKDAEDLLKRKKVQRDLIFEYLQNEGVLMPRNSDKPQLVQRTLEHWFLKKASVQPVNDVRQPQTRLPHVFFTTPSLTGDSSGLDLPALAREFCQWFYQLLNSQNPSLGRTAEAWGPQHFWEDVRLRLVSSAGHQYTEEIQGAEPVALRLLAMARDERLLLSPNLAPHGLRALSSPHGLVLAAVAGTIHRDASCLGVYEQVFGLVRSPLDDRWKIKFMEVKMRGSDGLSLGEETSSPVLTWDASDLQRLCTSAGPGTVIL